MNDGFASRHTDFLCQSGSARRSSGEIVYQTFFCPMSFPDTPQGRAALSQQANSDARQAFIMCVPLAALIAFCLVLLGLSATGNL